MSKDDNQAQLPASLSSAFASCMDLITTIPGAAKAVAKLVGSSAGAAGAWIDIGTAHGEQRSSLVRDKTKARSKVIEAMTAAAIAQAGDPDLGRRALEHFADEIVEKQANREAVTRLAIEQLVEKPPNDTENSEPSDDWLGIFSGYAERATSQKLREHWASCLAGEIRKPGSISLQTMKLLSIIDQESAELVQRYSRYVCFSTEDTFIPMDRTASDLISYGDLVLLDALGYLSVAAHGTEFESIVLGEFTLPVEPETKQQTLAALVTPAGIELTAFIGRKPTLEDAATIRKVLHTNGITTAVLETSSGKIMIPYEDANSDDCENDNGPASSQP